MIFSLSLRPPPPLPLSSPSASAGPVPSRVPTAASCSLPVQCPQRLERHIPRARRRGAAGGAAGRWPCLRERTPNPPLPRPLPASRAVCRTGPRGAPTAFPLSGALQHPALAGAPARSLPPRRSAELREAPLPAPQPANHSRLSARATGGLPDSVSSQTGLSEPPVFQHLETTTFCVCLALPWAAG